MRVPLLDLKSQYAKLKQPLDEAVLRVLASGRHVMGPEVEAFEHELAAYLGLPHAVGVSSGTDALLAAAMAALVARDGGQELLRPEDEVLTTSFSFFATPETAVRLGGRPVFCDLAEDSLNVDVGQMLSRVGPRTRLIVPVHLFGEQVDVGPLCQTGVPVIEDAAQTLAPGIGQRSLCATLSFFPSKNLGAAGDGGAVVTRDARVHDLLSVMRQHGSRPKYVHHVYGGNFRLDPLQAAVLRVKLKELPRWNAQRRRNALRYIERLAQIPGQPVRLPRDQEGHVWHHFVIRAPRRDELRQFLAERHIDTEVYYPLPLHLQPCFACYGYREGDCPRAEAAAREVLAIPVHPDLSDEQIDYVADAIARFYHA
jgi:dTDP-4-amino-4,6-dideoxygalactose transaminase